MSDRLPPAFALPLRFLGTATAAGATGAFLFSAVLIGIVLCQGGPIGLAFIAPAFAALAVFGTVGAALAILVYGVPVMLVLRAARIECLPTYLAAGAAGGGLALGCFDHSVDAPLLGLAGAVYGTATAGWFWFLFRRPRSAREDRG